MWSILLGSSPEVHLVFVRVSGDSKDFSS
jgi:hypothetical protein